MNFSKRIRVILKNSWLFLQDKENWPYVFFYIVIFFIFFINTFHEKYPDEFDNILGGWYLIHGMPIYSQWFSHHGPVPYFIAAALELFSRNSFVGFRALYSIFLFVITLGGYTYIRNKFGEKITRFYLVFIFLLAIMGNYYWLHMLLGDTVSAYSIVPAFSLLMLSGYYKVKFHARDLIVISLCTSLMLLSSLTYLFVGLIIYVYAAYLYFFSEEKHITLRRVCLFIGIMGAPYLIFLLYLLLTFSLKDYLYDGITFNQKYYAYTYPGADQARFINPIRFALTIANTFYNNYFTLLQQVTSFNTAYPLNITMAIGTFSLLIYFLTKKYYTLSIFFISVIIFANARSNPLTSAEHDYQSAVYILFAFVAISFFLFHISSFIEEKRLNAQQILLTVLIGVVSIYTLYSTGFLLQRFFNRSYQKYMGTMSLIYDRPHLAPILNSITKPGDPLWVGPFLYEEQLYLHTKLASKYQVLLPGMGSSPVIQQDFITELDKSRPEIIWFQKNFAILGRSPEQYGQFFIKYLANNYTTVGQYRGPKKEVYTTNLPIDEWIDVENRLYMRNDKTDEIIQRLLKHDYIYQKNK